MKILLKLSLLGVLAAAVAGCTAPNALSTKTAADGAYAVKTVGNNPWLNSKVSVERISMAYAGDLKKAALGIKGDWFVTKEFLYKIVWVDANNMEISPESSIWKPIQLAGRETKTVQSVAPNPSAVDVIVYLKAN